jgi:hypothetical protein
LHCCCVFIVSSPSSSPVDPATAAGASVIDYFVEDSFSSAEQPGKQNPLDHPDITYSFSLMLALELLLLLFR